MQKIILDIDTGIDDALAISYLLSRKEEADVLGLTTTYGNVYVDVAYDNTTRVLNALNRNDIKVYKGASDPLLEKFNYRPIKAVIHGKNGIGNVELPKANVKEETMPAWDFMIESALQYKDDLTIIPVGPLTNLAIAYQKNPNAFKGVKIVIMGGALTVPGNASKYAEANIFNDPEAAKIILEADLDVTMVGLDVTLQTLISDKEIQSWKTCYNIAAKALYDMSVYYYTFEAKGKGDPSGALHDPLAVEVALNPDIINQYVSTDLTVELEEPSRGRTTGKVSLIKDGPDKTKVAVQVKADEFVNKFVNSIYEMLKAL